MSWGINVCTYNVMLTVPKPLRFNGQNKRAKRIPAALARLDKQHELDVIVFVELIEPKTRKKVLDKMADLGWKYVSKPLTANAFFSSLKVVTGGVVVVSKHPILVQKNYIFDDVCEGFDCAACKGGVFVRIQKGDNIVNVVGTHFQAWDTPTARKIRLSQAADCKKLIDSMQIPPDEPVILAGDLNIDLYTRQLEIQRLCSTMNISVCERQAGSYKFTSDPSTNKLMGNDEDSMYATHKKVFNKGCYSEYLQTLSCPCCPQEWLDYVAYSTDHLRPAESHMFVIDNMKSDEPFKMHVNISTTRMVDDLSDHYPVVGHFVFDTDTPFGDRDIGSSLSKQHTISESWAITFGVLCLLVTLASTVLITLKSAG